MYGKVIRGQYIGREDRERGMGSFSVHKIEAIEDVPDYFYVYTQVDPYKAMDEIMLAVHSPHYEGAFWWGDPVAAAGVRRHFNESVEKVSAFTGWCQRSELDQGVSVDELATFGVYSQNISAHVDVYDADKFQALIHVGRHEIDAGSLHAFTNEYGMGTWLSDAQQVRWADRLKGEFEYTDSHVKFYEMPLKKTFFSALRKPALHTRPVALGGKKVGRNFCIDRVDYRADRLAQLFKRQYGAFEAAHENRRSRAANENVRGLSAQSRPQPVLEVLG